MEFFKHFDFGKKADKDAVNLHNMCLNPKTRERAIFEIEQLKRNWHGGEGADGMTLTRLFAFGIQEADITPRNNSQEIL